MNFIFCSYQTHNTLNVMTHRWNVIFVNAFNMNINHTINHKYTKKELLININKTKKKLTWWCGWCHIRWVHCFWIWRRLIRMHCYLLLKRNKHEQNKKRKIDLNIIINKDEKEKNKLLNSSDYLRSLCVSQCYSIGLLSSNAIHK